MKLKTKLSKLRHEGHITDAEYAIITNVLNKFSTQPPKTKPCEDAISRAEALRIAKSYYHAEFVVDKISQLPPVTPQQKTGKWIFHRPFDDGHKNCNECIECSQCHTWLGHDCYAKTPYCPICGAKMEVEE